MRLEKDYTDAFNAWQQSQDPKTTGDLLRAVDPVIRAGVRSFGGGAANSPTLYAQARKLALDAFNTYDPQKAPLKPHLMSNLQRLRRVSLQEQQIVRMPEQVARDRYNVDTATKELEDQLGRPPSDLELADHTGLSLKRLGHIRRGSRPLAESTLMQQSRYDDSRGGYQAGVESLDANYTPQMEFVHHDLNPTDQFIMERSFGLHGNPIMSATDIARKLKISPAAVSQRMARIQAQLDQLQDMGVF